MELYHYTRDNSRKQVNRHVGDVAHIAEVWNGDQPVDFVLGNTKDQAVNPLLSRYQISQQISGESPEPRY